MPATKQWVEICALQLFWIIAERFPEWRHRLSYELRSDGFPFVFLREVTSRNGLFEIVDDRFFGKFNVRPEFWVRVSRGSRDEKWREMDSSGSGGFFSIPPFDVGWRYKESVLMEPLPTLSDEGNGAKILSLVEPDRSPKPKPSEVEKPAFLRKVMD